MDIYPIATDPNTTSSFSAPELNLLSGATENIYSAQSEEEIFELQFVAVLSSN